jgi:hypothetical protein
LTSASFALNQEDSVIIVNSIHNPGLLSLMNNFSPTGAEDVKEFLDGVVPRKGCQEEQR